MMSERGAFSWANPAVRWSLTARVALRKSLILTPAADVVYRAIVVRVKNVAELHELQLSLVLRMLRGAHPQGHPRGEIASRMLTRSPDVTRLVDRLEEQGLVERDRVREDRRLSITRVTEKGLRLLEEMQPYIAEEQRRFANTVSRSDCIELSRICESIYEDEENPPPA